LAIFAKAILLYTQHPITVQIPIQIATPNIANTTRKATAAAVIVASLSAHYLSFIVQYQDEINIVPLAFISAIV